MALTKLTDDLDIIQKLDDEPNDVGGLTAAELKAEFDKAGNAVKKFINDTLTAELDAAVAEIINNKADKSITINGFDLSEPIELVGFDVGLGNVDNTSDAEKPVSAPQQEALDLKADKANVLSKDNAEAYTPAASYQPATKKYVDDTLGAVATGQLPDGSIGEAKLNESLSAKIAAVTPVGGIIMWSGEENSIPAKWALCNGQNGTPDLRNRFIVGAGGEYQVGATGGAKTITQTVDQMPAHTHSVENLTTTTNGSHTHTYSIGGNTQGSDYENASGNWNSVSKSTGSAGSHSHSLQGTLGATGGGQPMENRPPYYALCYIMYVG